MVKYYGIQIVFMENVETTEAMVREIRDWCLERHSELLNDERIDDAIALDSEFYEWLSTDEDEGDTLEILSISSSDG